MKILLNKNLSIIEYLYINTQLLNFHNEEHEFNDWNDILGGILPENTTTLEFTNELNNADIIVGYVDLLFYNKIWILPDQKELNHKNISHVMSVNKVITRFDFNKETFIGKYDDFSDNLIYSKYSGDKKNKFKLNNFVFITNILSSPMTSISLRNSDIIYLKDGKYCMYEPNLFLGGKYKKDITPVGLLQQQV